MKDYKLVIPMILVFLVENKFKQKSLEKVIRFFVSNFQATNQYQIQMNKKRREIKNKIQCVK